MSEMPRADLAINQPDVALIFEGGGMWNSYSAGALTVMLENGLFFVCLVDNEWSVAVELIQKDYNTGDYDDFMPSLQRRHYKNYLEGMKNCLLELYPEIGVYKGAWTSGTIKRSEAITS